MEYFLMRKDEVITLCEINDKGIMISFSPRYRNPELAPLEFRAYPDHISRWWDNRKIPVSQGKVQEMLKRKLETVRSRYGRSSHDFELYFHVEHGGAEHERGYAQLSGRAFQHERRGDGIRAGHSGRQNLRADGPFLPAFQGVH